MAAFPTQQSAAEQTSSAVLVVHNGALGDFLCCWPGLLAIARHFTGQAAPSPALPLYFLGREARLPWVTPLGYAPAPPHLRAAAESLYAAKELPPDLAGSKIFWFCLDRPPAFPCLQDPSAKDIIHLPILAPPAGAARHSSPPGQELSLHVLLNLKAQLKHYGLSWPSDWRAVWQELFGRWQGENSKEIAILPGSGHSHKQWPLRRFSALAAKLVARGWKPVFIIGEAEQARGLRPPPGQAWEDPSPPEVLGHRLRHMRAMLSNDAGPAHLAGLYGVPGVVLFGPTPPETWGVPGLVNLSGRGLHHLQSLVKAGVDTPAQHIKLNFNFKHAPAEARLPPCAPCTITLRDIACPAPLCMDSLGLDMVWTALATLLGEEP